MRRELYRSRTNPKNMHPARLGRKKPSVKPARRRVAPKQETFTNITQEQKHGRGPRR